MPERISVRSFRMLSNAGDFISVKSLIAQSNDAVVGLECRFCICSSIIISILICGQMIVTAHTCQRHGLNGWDGLLHGLGSIPSFKCQGEHGHDCI